MKKRIKSIIAASLSLVLVFSMTGCGSKERMEAEINPDTPVEDVEFPLKEKAELSFITSAPATSTQEPNERTIFKRLEKQTNVHIDWTCFVADQFSDKKNLALAQFGNLPDGLFNAGMSDYDLLRYAKQGIIIPLENLIDKYMPNLQAVFEKYPEYRNGTKEQYESGELSAATVLAELGGFDLAGMTGLFLGGAAAKIPVLTDGFLSTVSGLLAVLIRKEAKDYMLASHISTEPAGAAVLQMLDLPAPLHMGMHLGEGSGAVAMIPLLRMGAKVYEEMSTFSDISVEQYVDYQEKGERP